MSIEVEMVLKKETKGTYVYSDESDDAPVPTLYVKKSAFGAAPPGKIKLTLGVDKR